MNVPIHDSLMRAVFSNAKRAGEMLRLLGCRRLSEDMDLEALVPVPGRFVDQDLHQHETDLLFMNSDPDSSALLYVLIEHQSTPLEAMAVRLMRYGGRIYASMKAEDLKKHQVPPIHTVVLYHGTRPWEKGLSLGELHPRKNRARRSPLSFDVHYELINLRSIADELIRKESMRVEAAVTMALLAMKHAGSEEFAAMLEAHRDILSRLYHEHAQEELLQSFISYFMAAANVPSDQLARIVVPVTSEKVNDMIKTTAEKLREEGLQKGIQEGRYSERADVLLRLIEKRFGAVDKHVHQKIKDASPDELLVFFDRALELDDLEQVFKGTGCDS